MSRADAPFLRNRAGGRIADACRQVDLAELAAASSLHAPLDALRGRSVLIATAGQMAAALAAIELDGLARRIVLCPPELSGADLGSVIAEAAIDVVVTDGDPGLHGSGLPGFAGRVVRGGVVLHGAVVPDLGIETEWVLCTSGSTGRPKLVVHGAASLMPPPAQAGLVWATFYDIRRYGGLAVLLRAFQAGTLILSEADEPVGTFLARAADARVTHLTGTPSHWRRALMSPALMSPALMSPVLMSPVLMSPGLGGLSLESIRLSGEIADQNLIDRLRARFPQARLVHAFASTEAGLAFEVDDGQAGFPAALLDQPGRAELRIAAGTLRVRSPGTARCYLGAAATALLDAGGWVDTGDIIRLSGGRCHFAGRRAGVINVGGEKIFPEEVEAVIAAHPLVQACRVWGRPSPVLGALVAADVVFADRADRVQAGAEILAACQRRLPPHKVPARLRAVARLDLSASGKMRRSQADHA